MMLLMLVVLLVLGLLLFIINVRRKFPGIPGAGLQLPFIGHYQVRRSSYWSLAGQQPSYWSLAIQEAFLLVIVIVKQPSYESQAGQQPFY